MRARDRAATHAGAGGDPAVDRWQTDSVRCYLLDTAAVRRIQIIGIRRVSTDRSITSSVVTQVTTAKVS